MKKKQLKLTNTDYLAIEKVDRNYINNKGAKLYVEPTYKDAVEYYRLASAMGDAHAISNLGYCYLYGRGIDANLSFALAYFKIASMMKDIDACYKLGDIYSSDKWGVQDNEMSIYYYRMAISFILNDEDDDDDSWSKNTILWCAKLRKYPSLCFALGRELLSGKYMTKDVTISYLLLKHAYQGYSEALMNGDKMYQECFESVKEWLNNSEYDAVREELDKSYKYAINDDYDDEDEETDSDDEIENGVVTID